MVSISEGILSWTLGMLQKRKTSHSNCSLSRQQSISFSMTTNSWGLSWSFVATRLQSEFNFFKKSSTSTVSYEEKKWYLIISHWQLVILSFIHVPFVWCIVCFANAVCQQLLRKRLKKILLQYKNFQFNNVHSFHSLHVTT